MDTVLSSVPDWLSGIGGTVAAIIVAATYWRDRRRAAEDRAAELWRERRVQAERITYYLEKGHTAYDSKPDVQKRSGDRIPVDAGWFHYGDAPGYDWGYLVMVNHSESCAYAAVAHVPDGALDDGHNRGVGVIPPGVTRISMPMRQYPGEGSGAWTRHDGEFANNELVPWVEFKDQAGVAWRRGSDGALQEVTEPVSFPDYSA